MSETPESVASSNSEGVIKTFSGILAASGFLLICFSRSLGEASSIEWLQRHGGSMDMATLVVYMHASIDIYRTLGAVLLGVGLWRLFLPRGMGRLVGPPTATL